MFHSLSPFLNLRAPCIVLQIRHLRRHGFYLLVLFPGPLARRAALRPGNHPVCPGHRLQTELPSDRPPVYYEGSLRIMISTIWSCPPAWVPSTWNTSSMPISGHHIGASLTTPLQPIKRRVPAPATRSDFLHYPSCKFVTTLAAF